MNFHETYPTLGLKEEMISGLFPTDFILEAILDDGLKWFRATENAAELVFGQLLRPELTGRYGQEKVDEIESYIDTHEIRIIQSFPTEDAQFPSISINLQDGVEEVGQAGLNDFAGNEDDLSSLGEINSRTELGYIPFVDSILIGIHAAGSPDKVKYMAYLVTYILASSRQKLEAIGLQNMTFSATDLSRLNDYLPDNVFTRFITVRMSSKAKFHKGDVPVLDSISVNVKPG